MTLQRDDDGELGLSIVIASYNSAKWLPSTLEAIYRAISKSAWRAEVIVVDDGSTDATAEVLSSSTPPHGISLRVVSQANKGRFLARWAGVEAAHHAMTLVVDSRVLVHEESLNYALRMLDSDDGVQVWVGHIDIDTRTNLVGLFWSVPTHLFWGTYLARPRRMTISAENFDRMPKGTGFLLVPTRVFREASLAAWPEDDARLVSDDTKLLRFMVAQQDLVLDPEFSATYQPRTAVSRFLLHGRDRGTLFVDSYAGTTVARSAILILLGLLPPLALIALLILLVAGLWPIALLGVTLALVALAVPAPLAMANGCPPRAALSYLVFVIPFGAFFWAGLVRGLILHRRAFARRGKQDERLPT